ncbi:hypothetical protein [Aliiroseovarius sp. YM-037]|uniref:hypothetical protein n=1 Tax=Aliiroseovarius sp. YM-037 TaxID=3341728 RepID=UPI003A80B470
MSGNALEEGLMQQLGNPSHVDAGRVAVPFGAVAGILTYLILGAVFGGGWSIWRFLLAAIVCAGVGGMIYRMIERKRLDAENKRQAERRASQTAETERQIAEMVKRTEGEAR